LAGRLGISWQDAMTSKQIMLTLSLAALCVAVTLLGGCQKEQRVDAVKAPYEARQVFAVAPLRNESGSAYADGVRIADKITAQLALTKGLDTLPVNRVLSAMQALGLSAVTNKGDAIRLRQMLGVDGLVVGTITAYDPYEPPKLGLSLELYLDSRLVWQGSGFDTQKLSRSASDPTATLPTVAGPRDSPFRPSRVFTTRPIPTSMTCWWLMPPSGAWTVGER